MILGRSSPAHWHSQENCTVCGRVWCRERSHLMTEDEWEGME